MLRRLESVRYERLDPTLLFCAGLFILVGAMLLTGLLNVYLGVPVWMQLVHLALADALWVVYVFASAGALQASPATDSRLSPSR